MSLCDQRPGATRGSDPWCACNSKGQTITKADACEAAGRRHFCYWSSPSASCRSRGAPDAPPTTSQIPRNVVDCPTQHTPSEPRVQGLLTVATWNVEWLFDGIDDPPPTPALDAAAVSSKVKAVADVLDKLDADIIHLAEVENCMILESVGRRLNRSYQPFMIAGTDTYLRQQVALLSQIGPKSIRRSRERADLPGGKSTGISKHLVADFAVGGRDLQILGLHLKARPHQLDARLQREGQARIAQRIIGKALQLGKDVIVLGDLNDFDSDAPGPGGEKPSSSVLGMLKDVDNDGKPDLWNALESCGFATPARGNRKAAVISMRRFSTLKLHATAEALPELHACLDALGKRLQEELDHAPVVDSQMRAIATDEDKMTKDDKRDFIMFEGQQEYDWERSIGLKMKEQMRRRDVHTQECLQRVTRALTRRWRRQRDRDKAKSMEQIAALTKAMDATEAPRGPRLWTWCKMKDLALVNGMDPPFPGSAGQDS
ncbi:Uncharacterized protein SCF082_LOCUS52428 [Durusdinium trenchii]|uniref:Endonuclease/exonuclease/phosphatase domain-containing protein n=1 Tax=Durusdinium trenchii TaxID=1381693 RepID=A0ABP0SL35_9DINO